MASVIPKEVKKEIIDGYIAETWKVCLLTNLFTYVSGTHILYANLTNEVIGTGYTAGGAAVTKSAWGAGSGYVDTVNAYLDGTDVSWPTSTFANVQYAVVYETTGGKIRGVYDLGAVYSVTSGTFTLQWNPGGLIKVS